MYFSEIYLKLYLTKQLNSSERSDSIYCVTSALSEAQVIYIIYENYYIQWILLYSQWYLVPQFTR